MSTMNLALQEDNSSRRAQNEFHEPGNREYDEAWQGTPKDVRMFPVNSLEDRRGSNLVKSTSSRSIPIAPSKDSAADAQFDQDVALAEYRDFVMYQRIVTAKQRRHSSSSADHHQAPALQTGADSLQLLLAHNNFAYLQDMFQDHRLHPIPQQNVPLAHLPCLVSLSPGEEQPREDCTEEGIFELEL